MAGSGSKVRMHRHPVNQAMIEDAQNERLLQGNTEILQRVERLEHAILDLEHRIMERLGAPTQPGGGASPGQ